MALPLRFFLTRLGRGGLLAFGLLKVRSIILLFLIARIRLFFSEVELKRLVFGDKQQIAHIFASDFEFAL
jgi:hypothetical protein